MTTEQTTITTQELFDDTRKSLAGMRSLVIDLRLICQKELPNAGEAIANLTLAIRHIEDADARVIRANAAAADAESRK